MLQIISPQDSKIIVQNQSPQRNIDMINEHIKLCHCENMTIDISNLNIIDACSISTLCSAEHYLKYPNGKINWIVNSKAVEEYTSPISIGNSKYTVI